MTDRPKRGSFRLLMMKADIQRVGAAPEQLSAKLTGIGFDVRGIDVLEGGQLLKIAMISGRVLNCDRRLNSMHLVTQALAEVAPDQPPQDVGVNIAGERLTVGILAEGNREGRVVVGKGQAFVNWRP